MSVGVVIMRTIQCTDSALKPGVNVITLVLVTEGRSVEETLLFPSITLVSTDTDMYSGV